MLNYHRQADTNALTIYEGHRVLCTFSDVFDDDEAERLFKEIEYEYNQEHQPKYDDVEVEYDWSNPFGVKIDGKRISINTLDLIKNYVRASEIAEFLWNEFPKIPTMEEALDLAVEIRDLTYEGETESDAIAEVLDKYGYLEEVEDE